MHSTSAAAYKRENTHGALRLHLTQPLQLCLYLVVLLGVGHVARGDLACGAGKLLAQVAGQSTCVQCGDDATLAQATSFAPTCANNLGAIYCLDSDANNGCNICPLNSETVADEPAVASACKCRANYYGTAGGVCTQCPAGTHSPVDTASVNGCTCNAGTHGSVVAGVAMCAPCPMGSYCPGDGTAHACAGNKRTEPTTGSTSAANCKEPVCGNGILEGSEECDNGSFSEDGCDGTCKYEDPCHCNAGVQFVCTNTPFQQTQCCPSLVNPLTNAFVCTCAGLSVPTNAYTITADCHVHDVNECATNNGGCASNALCKNNVAGVGENTTHTCVCPKGLVGDGVVRCDVFLYQTHLKFELVGLSVGAVNVADLRQMLANGPAVFPGRTVDDILIEVSPYVDSGLDRAASELGSINVRRRLLDANHGVHVKVIVVSPDALSMQNLTAAVDPHGITQLLANWYDVAVNVLEAPENAIQTADSVYGTVSTVLTGFKVEGVVYNHTSWEWLVTVSYVPDSPNTITSMYVTRSKGEPPYPPEVADSFYVAKHPCMESTSVCCLLDYVTDYNVGVFASNVSGTVGACNTAMRARDTAGLFSVGSNDAFLLGTMSGLSESYVTRLSPTRLQLHIGRFALRNQISMRTPFTGGYDMNFFVGMSYFTMLPTNALATVASQTKVRARMTDSVTFATTSEQDNSFLEYITLALYQTKYVEADLIHEHAMQFVKVGFVFPETLRQNMKTGLVPLTSIRFAVSSSLPQVTQTSAWTNPCYSESNTGLFDNATSTLRQLYTESSYQQCSLQPNFCVNPATEVLATGLVELWFPIGDGRISDALLAENSQYSLYVYMDVSVYEPGEGNVVTKLFAQAPLTQLSFTRACEELELAQSVADMAEIDLNIGMASLESEWAESVTSFTNLIAQTRTASYLDTGLTIHAKSAQSGLMTLVVKGSDPVFSAPVAAPFHLEIEDLVSMHFLSESKYVAMKALMASGGAYSMVRNTGTGWLEIALTESATELCGTETIPGDFTCAVRKNIYQRNVVAPDVCHALATGVGTSDETRTVNWLQNNVLGVSDFARHMATNFTRLTRAKHAVNDRYKKAWFLSPMYRWAMDKYAPAQSVLGLSDHTVLIGILSLEDENPSGARRLRRFLLQVDDGVASVIEHLKEAPATPTMPPLFNTAVLPSHEMAAHVGIADKVWFLVSVRASAYYRPDRTARYVRDEMQERINAKVGQFSNAVRRVHLVQFLAQPDRPNRRRALLQTTSNAQGNATGVPQSGMLKWDGMLNLLMELKDDANRLAIDVIQFEIYQNYLKCAFFKANITTTEPGTQTPDCALTDMSEEGEGFIEDIFVTACKNYTTLQKCNSVVSVLSAGRDVPIIVPPVDPVKLNPLDVVGFRVYITITDDLMNVETMSAHQVREIKTIISQEFGLPTSSIILTGSSDERIDNPSLQRRRRRQLLDVSMVWEVRVPPPSADPATSFNWTNVNVNAKAVNIATKLGELGYKVNVELVSFEPLLYGATPVPRKPDEKTDDTEDNDKDEKDDDNSSTVILAILITVLVLVAVAIVVFGYWACFMRKSMKKFESASAKNAGHPSVEYVSVPTQTSAHHLAQENTRWRSGYAGM